MPDNPQKDTLTSQHVKTLQDLVKQAEKYIAAAKKIDEDSVDELEQARDVVNRRIANLERQVATLPLSHKDYSGTKDAVVTLHKAAKKRAGEIKLRGGKPKVVLKVGGNEQTEKEVVNTIKKYLPSSGHGNISQSLNDVVLGRGKATTGLTGVLHASAGPKQAGKGCTLFFTRGSGENDIVAIGQHEEVSKGAKPKYKIYYSWNSKLKKGKTIQL